MHIVKTRKSFRKEFKRQLRFSIAAAIGFTTAYAWRNAIYDSLYEIVTRFTEETRTAATEIYTAIFITIVGVVLILITSKLLKE